MLLSELEPIVTQAIQAKKVIEVDYIREEDSARTCRLMEPFDIAAGRRAKSPELRFWGWCLFHDRIEQKIIANIISVQITDQSFDPKVCERTFKSPPTYRIPRSW